MLAPVAIADAVEVWARQQGRHARMEWNRLMRCWVIVLDLRADDPRLKRWQAGKLRWKPTESVPLHYWDRKAKKYVALDIEQCGPSGMVERLDKANLLSGRGEHNTLYGALKAVEEQNATNRERIAAEFEDIGRETAWLSRRKVAGLPLVSVPADIKSEE